MFVRVSKTELLAKLDELVARHPDAEYIDIEPDAADGTDHPGVLNLSINHAPFQTDLVFCESRPEAANFEVDAG